jgi:hypothetical protein
MVVCNKATYIGYKYFKLFKVNFGHQKEIGFSFRFPDAGVQTRDESGFGQFACFVDTRPETGKNPIH